MFHQLLRKEPIESNTVLAEEATFPSTIVASTDLLRSRARRVFMCIHCTFCVGFRLDYCGCGYFTAR